MYDAAKWWPIILYAFFCFWSQKSIKWPNSGWLFDYNKTALMANFQPQNCILGGQLSSTWVNWENPWPGVDVPCTEWPGIRSQRCAVQFSASPQIKCRNKLVLIARLTFSRTKRYKLTRKFIFIISHYSLLWGRAGEMIRICSSEALPWNSCNFKIAFALLFFSRDLSC